MVLCDCDDADFGRASCRAGIAVELAITLILLQFADVSMKNVRVQMLASWRLLEEKTLSISLLLVRTLTCGKSCKRFVTFIKYYIFLMLIPMVRYVFLFNILNNKNLII